MFFSSFLSFFLLSSFFVLHLTPYFVVISFFCNSVVNTSLLASFPYGSANTQEVRFVHPSHHLLRSCKQELVSDGSLPLTGVGAQLPLVLHCPSVNEAVLLYSVASPFFLLSSFIPSFLHSFLHSSCFPAVWEYLHRSV